MENRHHVLVASDDPSMKEWIPKHRFTVPELTVEGIWISGDRRVEKLVKAEATVRFRRQSIRDFGAHLRTKGMSGAPERGCSMPSSSSRSCSITVAISAEVGGS